MKLSKSLKEYKTIISVTIVVLILCIGILIFIQNESNNQEEETTNNVKHFEIPDEMYDEVEQELQTSQNSNATEENNQQSKTIDTQIRISKETACDIADEEAKKSKYQYQPWTSEFTSKNMFFDGNGNAILLAELVTEFDQTNFVYYWEKQWEIPGAYQGQPMWYVRLGDKNDPLTSLYIYVDATNGNVLGAGKASD